MFRQANMMVGMSLLHRADRKLYSGPPASYRALGYSSRVTLFIGLLALPSLICCWPMSHPIRCDTAIVMQGRLAYASEEMKSATAAGVAFTHDAE